jgi:hypothetical protein
MAILKAMPGNKKDDHVLKQPYNNWIYLEFLIEKAYLAVVDLVPSFRETKRFCRCYQQDEEQAV